MCVYVYVCVCVCVCVCVRRTIDMEFAYKGGVLELGEHILSVIFVEPQPIYIYIYIYIYKVG